MIRCALILAAHGSRTDPSVNETIQGYARRLGAWGDHDEVTAAFHHGEPTFATVLDRIEATEITVVPVMTSEGYFSDVVLPRELARNRRRGNVRLVCTQPVGTHPAIADLVQRRVRRLLDANDLDKSDTILAVVGHGTGRHPRSRAATENLAGMLMRRSPCREVRPVFLDEAPRVETLLEGTDSASVCAIPFLIGGGAHATYDTPRRLGLDVSSDARPPFRGCVGRRVVVCDAAVGTDPGIARIIAELGGAAEPVCAPQDSYPTSRGL